MVNKKAQMKIQQMAFMIVAVVVFFAMVAVIYFSISLSSLDSKVQALRDNEARELVNQISKSPEFSFTSSSDCEDCIDLEKAFYISKNEKYKKRFWNLDYLTIERIYPNNSAGEKTCLRLEDFKNNLCNQIIVINSSIFATKTSFVSLAVWDSDTGNYKYELGRMQASSPQLRGEDE